MLLPSQVALRSRHFAASHSALLTDVAERTDVAASATFGLSTARGGCPNEVRSCTCMSHLLTLATVRALHYPRGLISPDTPNADCRTPKAFWPLRGCRFAAAARRLRLGGRGDGRWGRCGCRRSRRAREDGRRCRRCVGHLGRHTCGALAAGRSVQGGRAAGPLAYGLPACREPFHGEQPCHASNRVGSPVAVSGFADPLCTVGRQIQSTESERLYRPRGGRAAAGS